MLAPSIYNDFVSSLFNGFGDMFTVSDDYSHTNRALSINTDIKEYEDHYLLMLELPGYSKGDIKAEVKNGYLNVWAKKSESSEDSEDGGKYIHRELCYGEAKRSFFVGKEVTKENINASFENGILKLNVEKVQPKLEKEETNQISIS